MAGIGEFDSPQAVQEYIQYRKDCLTRTAGTFAEALSGLMERTAGQSYPIYLESGEIEITKALIKVTSSARRVWIREIDELTHALHSSDTEQSS